MSKTKTYQTINILYIFSYFKSELPKFYHYHSENGKVSLKLKINLVSDKLIIDHNNKRGDSHNMLSQLSNCGVVGIIEQRLTANENYWARKLENVPESIYKI